MRSRDVLKWNEHLETIGHHRKLLLLNVQSNRVALIVRVTCFRFWHRWGNLFALWYFFNVPLVPPNVCFVIELGWSTIWSLRFDKIWPHLWLKMKYHIVRLDIRQRYNLQILANLYKHVVFFERSKACEENASFIGGKFVPNAKRHCTYIRLDSTSKFATFKIIGNNS